MPSLLDEAGLTGVRTSFAGDTALASEAVDQTVHDLGRVAAAAKGTVVRELLLAEQALEHQGGEAEGGGQGQDARRKEVQRGDERAQEQREEQEVDRRARPPRRDSGRGRSGRRPRRPAQYPRRTRSVPRQPGVVQEARHGVLEATELVDGPSPERVGVEDHQVPRGGSRLGDGEPLRQLLEWRWPGRPRRPRPAGARGPAAGRPVGRPSRRAPAPGSGRPSGTGCRRRTLAARRRRRRAPSRPWAGPRSA